MFVVPLSLRVVVPDDADPINDIDKRVFKAMRLIPGGQNLPHPDLNDASVIFNDFQVLDQTAFH